MWQALIANRLLILKQQAQVLSRESKGLTTASRSVVDG